MTDLKERWAKVEGAVLGADSVAFDGCHKIYVLMDAGQTTQMVEYGYREDGSQMLLRSEGATPEQMLESLHSWYDESCGLKFINAVSSVAEGVDANERFTTLIGQFEDQDEEEDDVEDEGE